ncbi:hypothetical protein GH5_02102 [Leishmania sp. Ghana 2012 LV757]|uniref:hypothetical protein n=1 Tax=Leishmania sp. Ghana 2012 LV757 TaxID=2803181 RepID=UPI001B497607|nr:hypothetical protein GH5_02102 [Leishmania sp. Ghana 2012 LV757]
MLQLAARTREEPMSIPELFVRFLKASTSTAQLDMVRLNPSLFTDDVVATLMDAHAQINETLREVKEACRMIDAVSGSLELTGTHVELQPSESRALLDEETILQNFATSLASLLTARENAGPAVPSATPSLSAANHASSSLVAPQPNAPGAWFTQPSIVFSILAFLSVEEILTEAESVCRSWQSWLFLPDMSRFFWVGCVQREFPLQLQGLLHAAGDDLYCSDWRSLAMLCVTDAENAGDVERGTQVGEEGDMAGAALTLSPLQSLHANSGNDSN